MPSPESTRERKRRFRERQKRGAIVVPVEISLGAVEALASEGWLECRQDGEEARVFRQDIAAAIEGFIADWAAGATP